MTAWEYQVLRTGIKLQFKELWTSKIRGTSTGWDLIQQLGEEGWELVSSFPVDSAEGGTNAVGWVFKRPIKAEEVATGRRAPQPIDLD